MNADKETPVWLVTDTHLNHEMLSRKGYRPQGFEDQILHNLSHLVREGSVLIHMGDVCIGDDAAQHARMLWAVREARSKVLIRGNHDKKSDTWYYRAGWDLVVSELWLERYGWDIVLSHEPRVFGPGFVPWPELRNIHGHTHGNGHRSVDVRDYYNPAYHVELALEHTNYEPVQLARYQKIWKKGGD